jgi:serpin B
MNQWASDNTNGKIPKVLDEISWEAVMFLMNALYFKGDWTWQFDPDKTKDGDFLMEDGSTVTVPVMYGNVPVKVHAGSGYTAAEMFYGRKNFSMVLMVPQGSVDDFIESFTAEEFQDLTTALDEIPEPVEKDVFIPKFKFDYEKILTDQLKTLGMIDAFDPILADFSGISDTPIFISFVKQNTFIEVNEEGTEAAAVTTIGFEFTSIESFSADRPFVFAIRERTTNTLLFVGKVLDPS